MKKPFERKTPLVPPVPEPEPEPEPAIQLTPVEFSPKSPSGTDNSEMPPLRQVYLYPVFWPMLIILMTLIFSTARDMVALNRRMAEINEENTPALDLLKKSAKTGEFLEKMRLSLVKLAPNDPYAAQILTDFFPPRPKPKPAADDNGAKPSGT